MGGAENEWGLHQGRVMGPDQWALCQPQELKLGRKDAHLSSRRGRHADMWASKATSVGFVRELEMGVF